MKKDTLLAALFSLLFSASVFAVEHQADRFFSAMQIINKLEIDAGAEVQKRGINGEAIAYGKKISARHEVMSAELMAFIKNHGITLQSPETVAWKELSEQVKVVKSLKGLTGARLDQAFADSMFKVHALSLQNLYGSQYVLRGTEAGQFLDKLIAGVREGYDVSVKLTDVVSKGNIPQSAE